MAEPHQDLVLLILQRLPVKALFRFRCVSKSWKQLIDSKSFILGHLAVQSQRPRLIAQHYHSSNHLLLLDPRTLPHSETLTLTSSHEVIRKYPVVTSLHGVICHYYDDDNINGDLLLLWNPSTRQFLKIPLGYRDGFKRCSFWIDPSNNEFKIAIMSTTGDTSKVDLFSSRTKAWAEVGKCHVGDDGYFFMLKVSQVQIDGVTHWMGFNDTSCRQIVVSFDFGKDKIGTIELPEQAQPDPRLRNTNACKWKDSLSVVRWWCDSPYTCDLWVMQNGSWSKMFSFDLNRRFSNVFCVLESWGRGLASTMPLNGDSHLVMYDSNGSTSIPVKPRFEIRGGFSMAYDYVESLVFPDLKCISSDGLFLGNQSRCFFTSGIISASTINQF